MVISFPSAMNDDVDVNWFSMEKNKLKKIASINLDSSRDVGMVYHETKTKYTFVKSDKNFYDIKYNKMEYHKSVIGVIISIIASITIISILYFLQN